MKKDQFDRYCEWLFPILSRLEAVIDVKHYSVYQKRVFGFLAERLLNIYIYAKKIKTSEKGILFFDDSGKVANLSFLKSCINNLRSNISFLLIRPRKNAKI